MRRASSWKTSCRRTRHGEEPRLAEYKERFPSMRNPWRRWSRFARSSDQRRAPLSPSGYPEPGVEIFGFRLKSSLGPERSPPSGCPNRLILQAATWY